MPRTRAWLLWIADQTTLGKAHLFVVLVSGNGREYSMSCIGAEEADREPRHQNITRQPKVGIDQDEPRRSQARSTQVP